METKIDVSEYDDKFDEFFKIVKETGQYDCEKIEQAYNIAKKAHEGQFRRSGEPYIMLSLIHI